MKNTPSRNNEFRDGVFSLSFQLPHTLPLQELPEKRRLQLFLRYASRDAVRQFVKRCHSKELLHPLLVVRFQHFPLQEMRRDVRIARDKMPKLRIFANGHVQEKVIKEIIWRGIFLLPKNMEQVSHRFKNRMMWNGRNEPVGCRNPWTPAGDLRIQEEWVTCEECPRIPAAIHRGIYPDAAMTHKKLCPQDVRKMCFRYFSLPVFFLNDLWKSNEAAIILFCDNVNLPILRHVPHK